MKTARQRQAGRPTLEDVAALAGVSRATVSRVVNGHATVDPALSEVVAAAVAKLGYAPNPAARTLMTRRTDAIALVAAEPGSRVFGDPFFSSIIRGVSHELSRAGQQLILSMVQERSEVDRVLNYLIGGHVDGVLLISQHEQDKLASALVRAKVPLVIGGRPIGAATVPHVDHDNVGGAQLATRHLLGLGRQRIGTIAGPQDMSAGIDRLQGFRAALGRRFRVGLTVVGDFSTASGYAATLTVLDRAPDVDALFVANDLMALGALRALRSRGRRVPDDVAVVGYDDVELAAEADPPLTTVRQDTTEQGRAMVRMLLRRIGHQQQGPARSSRREPAQLVLPVELIVRQSA